MKYLIVLLFFLFANTIYSQKGSFYITPMLGVQMPLSKVYLNEYSKGILKNNRLEVEAHYGIKLEKEMKNKNIIFLSYQNGASGYAIKVDSKRCNNYDSNFSIQGLSSSFNNKRLNMGYQINLNNKDKIHQTKFYIKTSFIASLAIDIKGNENDTSGDMRVIGINRCGELYFLEDIVPKRKPYSVSLPLGFNFELVHGQKRKLSLNIMYTQGITTNTMFQIDYVTTTYRDKAFLKNKGSGFLVSLNYPIRVSKK